MALAITLDNLHNMNNIPDILKRNSLSITDGRMKILELFYNSDGALAHADIEKKTGLAVDRVTVYRTLQTFVEKGIIHMITMYILFVTNVKQPFASMK